MTVRLEDLSTGKIYYGRSANTDVVVRTDGWIDGRHDKMCVLPVCVYVYTEPPVTGTPHAPPQLTHHNNIQVAATQAYLSALNRVAVSRGSLPVHPQFGKI